MYQNVHIITALVTPFTTTDEIDYPALTELIEHLLAHGSQGFIVGGTTGESPTLTQDEKEALTTFVAQKVAGRALVIANVGTNSTAESVQHAQQLSRIAGVDAVLAVTPYYNKPSQAGMIAHFTAIAAASAVPVMLYNIPGRSVVGLTVESVVTLAQNPNINAIKEVTTIDNIAAIVAQTQDFAVYTGEDAQTLSALAVGANGVVSVSSHIYGDEMMQLVTAVKSGDVTTAGDIQRQLTPKMNALFAFPSPAPVKALLAQEGRIHNLLRLPLLPLTGEEQQTLRELTGE
jgi:4-hydroxy-tetrahydrodipicolinate synthase